VCKKKESYSNSISDVGRDKLVWDSPIYEGQYGPKEKNKKFRVMVPVSKLWVWFKNRRNK